MGWGVPWETLIFLWHKSCLEVKVVFLVTLTVRLARVGPLRQHYSGCLYHPPGWAEHMPLILLWAKTLPEGNLHSSMQILEQTSSWGRGWRPGDGSSTRGTAERKWICSPPRSQPSVPFYSHTSSSSGAECHGAYLADASSVCLSLNISASGSPSQGLARTPLIISGYMLAHTYCVLGPNMCSPQHSMGDSHLEGPLY